MTFTNLKNELNTIRSKLYDLEQRDTQVMNTVDIDHLSTLELQRRCLILVEKLRQEESDKRLQEYKTDEMHTIMFEVYIHFLIIISEKRLREKIIRNDASTYNAIFILTKTTSKL